jgi:chitodextrinase
MRKTLLVFTTMALALLLAAGMAWAAHPAPTVSSTLNGATGVLTNANITATFSDSEGMRAKSINTDTFYLLKGNFTANPQPSNNYAKNPPKRCYTAGVLVPCGAAIPATVSYTAGTNGGTATLNPTNLLLANTTYTAVVEGTGDGDYVAVKDAGGTAMYTDYIFHFTTAP